ncbi:MAG: ABC transporter permease [Desulfovibrio sp.]|jgi:lipopolysaccharide transport system permease protein|nr:ABC transporter permease [Desulfovibrio sp.]
MRNATPEPRDFELVIEAGRLDLQYWKDLWRYRDLLWILCRRDLTVRYKQTVIGALWAVIRPLVTILTFTLLLGKVAKLPSEPGVPYSALVFSGMLIWNFFAQCLGDASNSLLANANLVGKIYLPRLLIPVSAVAVAAADFAVALVLFAGLLWWFGIAPPLQCALLPVFVLLAGLLALGPGLVLAALSLPYRDIRHTIPVIVQLGMYVSPVVYTSALVPEKWQWLYILNPMVGVVDGFRWAALGSPAFPALSLAVSCAWCAGLLLAGMTLFRRMERTFVDVL